MILNLGDVISMATQFAGRSDFSISEVSKLANIALTEVTSRVYHKAKEYTAVSNVTGTGNERRVDLPTDFDGVVSLAFYSTSTNSAGTNVLGDATVLMPGGPYMVDSMSSDTGTPLRYAVFADFIELDPIPGSRGSLVMRYLAKQQTLVVSTDTPFLDERWHMGWVNKTEELVHRSRANYAGAAEAERRYVNFMVSTPTDRGLEQMDKNMGLWVKKK